MAYEYFFFDYATEGVFTRASSAWVHHPITGLVSAEFLDDERRVVDILGEDWILIEGPRTNIIPNPTSWTTWTAVTPDQAFDNPQGGPLSNLIASGDDGFVPIYATPTAVTVTGSVFAIGENGSVFEIWLSIDNSVDPSPAQVEVGPEWRRLLLGPRDVSSPAGTKNFHVNEFAGAENLFGWGAQVERGPGVTDSARFMTSPILAAGPATRAGEDFNVGQFTAEILELATGLRIRFRPDFASADVVNTETYALFFVGTLFELVGVTLTATGTGVLHVEGGALIVGGVVQTPIVSGAVTFDAGDELTIDVLRVGELVVAGATTGNGTFAGDPFEIQNTEDVVIGGFGGAAWAFGYVSPLGLLFEQPTVIGIEQLTLNSARVTYSEDMIEFDHNGIRDALNTALYTVTGTPGLPRLQVIMPGPGSAVDLFFDGPIAEGALVRVAIADVASDTLPPVPVIPANVEFIAFGAEVNATLAAEGSLRRVDIANPQTTQDAGTSTLGTIPITDTGDLANDSGRAGLRKRIYRRLSTVRNGFLHLKDFGLRPQDKSPITPTSLRQLQLDCEQQVLAEQGVVSVRVRVSEIAPGVVSVRLTVEDDNGSFEMAGQLDFTGA